MKINKQERRKYVLKEDRDFEILKGCKKLEKLKLTEEDKYLIRFIKTQLYNDWRKPILKELNKLTKKYKK